MKPAYIQAVLDSTVNGDDRARALNVAFTWSNTKQGHDYWANVSRRLRNGHGLSGTEIVQLQALLDQAIAHSTNETPEKGTPSMPTLYYHAVSNTYGKYLCVDGQDRIVLEMQSGEIKAFKRDEIEEVTPYTVDVAQLSGTLVPYRTKAGAVKVGDIVVLDGPGVVFARVAAIDTKNKSATKILKGIVINGTPIATPDET